MPTIAGPITTTESDAQQALSCVEPLSRMLSPGSTANLRVTSQDGKAVDLALPLSVTHALVRVLRAMGQGNGVAVTSIGKELTTQQAAGVLGVSRPYLIEELLEKGLIPYRKVGNRRRIRMDDVLRYREAEEREVARREAVVREMVAETELLGLYR
ncbi:MAG: helix-turn-helix domain-containing protein [Armatimonadetes bacterium]|nr:helix-turn-helix domain-containing protein [Armatimonadota bacterium]